ncbi:hypothetical protein A28LD_0790 [Idiomarina sp. A28L]|uniref:DUF1414 domain-containing protein n=1 Tax=Idiomarina sp. A28L TaxID=1036674 RepID=UPI000213888C|nr:DUF1414 domain-containing protein [Idiomarina sp. A28L]EGN75744.1 hypothetical protein A28LD_0790 [Idiomarina sp. A28L]
MPIVSKYDQERQDQLIDSILDILAKDKAPNDLALMTLGNVVTHILQEHVPAQKRQAIAKQFGQILLQSVAKEQ